MTGKCDVVLTPNQGIYINGTLIENVTSMGLTRDGGFVTVLTIEVHPTSLVFGDVPTQTIEDLQAERLPDDETVNINVAISRAMARRAGIPHAVAHLPLPPTSPTPEPVAKKTSHPKYAMDQEADLCNAGIGGGEVCSRTYGHAGAHRS